jgi:hypothetical protein
MQKTLTTIFCLLIISLSSFATNISGVINTNTTWTKASSPYIITADVVFDTGAVLTIEPGAIVNINGHNMFIDGKINAQGTVTDTISVTGGVFNIRNHTSTDTLIFDYCHFLSAGIKAWGIQPIKVTNSIFYYSVVGISYNAYALINNCSFSHNACGIQSVGNSPCRVTNSTFMHNSQYGILINVWHSDNYCANNVFHDNSTAVVRCTYVYNNVITGSSNRGVEGCSYISYNQIWYNKVGIEGGIGFAATHNSIEYNSIGILNPGNTSPVIKNNCITNNATYDYINGWGDKDISGNYWGGTDSVKIASKISDFYDNFSDGKAMFIPMLATKDSACADTVIKPTTIPVTTQFTNITIYPNPFGNLLTIQASNNQIIKEVSVYNLIGIEIINTTTSNNEITIDASSLPHGIYLYKVRLSDESIVTGKVLKE